MTTATIPPLERARAYVAQCPEAVAGQGGHAKTFAVACALVNGFALSAEDALAVLADYNARCVPPWSDAQLRYKVESASKANHAKPRGYLLGGGKGQTVEKWTTPKKRQVLTRPANQNAPQGRTDPLLRIPDNAPPPPIAHPKLGKSAYAWTYLDRTGAPVGYAVRFDGPEGKQVLPLTWGADGWQWKAMPEPRPLYGLPDLLAHPALAVIVVEGEKSADAAQRMVSGGAVAITWPGGAQAWGKADWSPLKGRKVILWPDADKAGNDAMKGIRAHLLGQFGAASANLLSLPPGLPAGWDAADAEAEEWTSAEVLRLMRGQLIAPDGLCPLCWVRSIAALLGGPTCKHGKWEWRDFATVP